MPWILKIEDRWIQMHQNHDQMQRVFTSVGIPDARMQDFGFVSVERAITMHVVRIVSPSSCLMVP
eukprot:5917089-Amphidinium_carterae.1